MAEAILSKSGVYAIRNITNGKCYIGGSSNIRMRWNSHTYCLRKNKHHSPKLQAAWNLFGANQFQLIIIEEVKGHDQIVTREQHWIDCENAVSDGYNVCPSAADMSGFIFSDQSRAKISASLIGNTYTRGYKHSLETRAKVTAAGMGRKHSAETIKKMSDIKKGKVFSEETRKRLSDAAKNRVYSPETRAKMSAARMGVKRGKRLDFNNAAVGQ